MSKKKQRSLENYFGIDTKSGHANLRHAYQEKATGKPPRQATNVVYKLQDFLTDNFLAWLIHDFRVKKQYKYISKITAKSMHKLASQHDADTPITVGLAADWATDTPQSKFVGLKMKDLNLDYTIHLGDTYYAGNTEELINNFGGGTNKDDRGLWPRGKMGSFALTGNHEMFSSGKPFFDMITCPKRAFGASNAQTDSFAGQEAPCFYLETDHWCIIGLDTGYNSLVRNILRLNPSNVDLTLPKQIIRWLKDVVKIGTTKKGIVVLTHHQYISAFKGEDEFSIPAKQLQKLIPDREIIWIWGHEHRFSIYGKYKQGPAYISAFGRCIGNGGMPTEIGRNMLEKERNLVLYDNRLADTLTIGKKSKNAKKIEIGYNGYAVLKLNKELLTIDYYAAYGGTDKHAVNENIFREEWTSDNLTGTIKLKTATDSCQYKLRFMQNKTPLSVGKE